MDRQSARGDNLVLQAGVSVTASQQAASGPGARDPMVLANDLIYKVERWMLADFDQRRTFDTYDGQNAARSPDWYAISFPVPTTLTCVEMTMGFPYRDGGWWTSLALEYRTLGDQTWRPVQNPRSAPHYDFSDSRKQRRPFETFVFTFDPIIATELRLIGTAGGIAQFTSLARLAAYNRSYGRSNAIFLPPPPLPDIFRLIAPHTIWDLSEGLAKLSGITVSMPLIEFFLDEQRYQQRWQRLRHNYEGQPDLWFLLGETLGWAQLNRYDIVDKATTPEPQLLERYGMASAVAPVVVEGRVLSEIKTHPVIIADSFDRARHRAFAEESQLDWARYQAAIDRTLHLRREQIEGAAVIIGMIASTIANLAHQLAIAPQRSHDSHVSRTVLIRRAIRQMDEHLEEPIEIAALARSIGLSTSHFCTLFSQELGLTPIEYQIQLRIERAKAYLSYSELSVTEVAAALGYSRSYFTRLFTRNTGSTPGHYRATHRIRATSQN
jgi:AraC-like DNA-binding protein